MFNQWFKAVSGVVVGLALLSGCSGGSSGNDDSDDRSDPQAAVPIAIELAGSSPIEVYYNQATLMSVDIVYDDGSRRSSSDYSVQINDSTMVSFDDVSDLLLGLYPAQDSSDTAPIVMAAQLSEGELATDFSFTYYPFDTANAQFTIDMPSALDPLTNHTPTITANWEGIALDVSNDVTWSLSSNTYARLIELPNGVVVTPINEGGPTTLTAFVWSRQANTQFVVGEQTDTPVDYRLSQTSLQLNKGESAQLTMEVRVNNGAWEIYNQNVVWTSENQIVAVVSHAGLVRAVESGEATILALVDGDLYSATVNVFDDELDIRSIDFKISDQELEVDESTNWEVTVRYSDNTTSIVTNNVDTSVDKAGVVSISGSNIVATNEGVANITASYLGFSDSAIVTVAPKPNPAPTSGFKPVRKTAIADDVFYFIVTDRFYDGDPSNNYGSGNASDGKNVTGYDKTDPNYYHGGDLAGIEQQIPYLKGLGITALWITPPFVNVPVDSITDGSYFSSYHGYWTTDYMNVDPHLGGNNALRSLIEALHENDMKLFLDIATNHTARRTTYSEAERPAYRDISSHPYRDKFGNIFDPLSAAYGSTFPELSVSNMPYEPKFDTNRNVTLNPDWMNDMTNYHHRGVTGNYYGQELTHGELVGLDDLFTENPRVVEGMIDIFSYWVREFKFDGYRIDAAKHLNKEFFQAFSEAIRAEAASVGIDHFYMFGEGLSYDVSEVREFIMDSDIRGGIDFPVHNAIMEYAYRGKSRDNLSNAFSQDDQYITANTHAGDMLPFVSNHDDIRAGIELNDLSDDEAIKRQLLGHALMTFVRGTPIFYYGDEQGFTGDRRGSRGTRQDMMASQVNIFNNLDLIGTNATMAEDNFDTNHPLYKGFASLIEVYKAHPTLRHGMFNDYGGISSNNLYAFFRHNIESGERYILVANNAKSSKTATFDSLEDGRFINIYPGNKSALNTSNGNVTVTVNGLEFAIYMLEAPSPDTNSAPKVTYASLDNGDGLHGRDRVVAKVANVTHATVAFNLSVNGAEPEYIGSDNTWPYAIYVDTRKLPFNADLRLTAIAKGSGNQTDSESKNIKVGGKAGEVIIHYQRPKGDYQGWGIHYFGDGAVDTPEWGQPLQPATRDAYGQIYRIPVDTSSDELGFIVTNGTDKDPNVGAGEGGDRFVTPSEVREIWLKEGDDKVYWQKPG